MKKKKKYKKGWQCPICLVVMSPKEKTCSNCKGIGIIIKENIYTPPPIIEPPQNIVLLYGVIK